MPDCRKSHLIFQNFLGEVPQTPPQFGGVWGRSVRGFAPLPPPLSKIPGSAPGYYCYWKLFNKLLDDKIDINIVKILCYWYTKQEFCVRWLTSLSSFFTIGNGTRQGGIFMNKFIHHEGRLNNNMQKWLNK